MTSRFMDLQRIDLKVLVDAPRDIRLDSLLAIFGRWRNDRGHSAQWVDLADYAHMSRGAGVLIIGKQGQFGITRSDPGLGLFYSGRQGYQGSPRQRIIETFRRHLDLSVALLEEPDYPAELSAAAGTWELAINDRLDYPNSRETDRLLKSDIEAALSALFGVGQYATHFESDPGRRYGLVIHAGRSADLRALRETAARLG
jgi:hypothetical protein